jgi:hypothetical protein
MWGVSIHAALTEKYRWITASLLYIPDCQRKSTMDLLESTNENVRDPLAWAADCSTYASTETDPEARDAYAQLAQEFESVATEIEGLISTFEALANRKRRG